MVTCAIEQLHEKNKRNKEQNLRIPLHLRMILRRDRCIELGVQKNVLFTSNSGDLFFPQNA